MQLFWAVLQFLVKALTIVENHARKRKEKQDRSIIDEAASYRKLRSALEARKRAEDQFDTKNHIDISDRDNATKLRQ